MHIYNVSEIASNKNGECVLGSAELKTHACYLVYGVLEPGKKERLIKPGKGHEEIVCLVSGRVMLKGEEEIFALEAGEAFYLRGEESYLMDNNGENNAVYVISGGHSEHHEH